MHELSVASAVLDRAVEHAERAGAEEIEALRIEVGEATHVAPDQLRRTVETVAVDTPAEGAEVDMETVEPAGRCDCGWSGTPTKLEEFAMVAPDRTCPECGDRVELTAGDGCRLASITIPD